MERGEPADEVRRIELPSGKAIHVVPRRDETREDLHLCISCLSELVYPVAWEEAGPQDWKVLLRCPDCHTHREGIFSQPSVDALDVELDLGREALARDYGRLLRANMTAEIDRFVGALQAEAILPEDF